MTWCDFACKFTDFKGKAASAKYRHDINPCAYRSHTCHARRRQGQPSDLELRTDMRRGAFNTKRRTTIAMSVHPARSLRASWATVRTWWGPMEPFVWLNVPYVSG